MFKLAVIGEKKRIARKNNIPLLGMVRQQLGIGSSQIHDVFKVLREESFKLEKL